MNVTINIVFCVQLEKWAASTLLIRVINERLAVTVMHMFLHDILAVMKTYSLTTW